MQNAPCDANDRLFPKQILMRMSMLPRLKEAAAKERLSVNEFVRLAIEEKIAIKKIREQADGA